MGRTITHMFRQEREGNRRGMGRKREPAADRDHKRQNEVTGGRSRSPAEAD